MLKIKKYLPLIIVSAYFMLHIPFLSSDPDTAADPETRGAWIDEGLYPMQVKNLVNHGTLGMKDTDGFIKAPFYNIVRIPGFYIFGTSLAVSRIITLIFVLLALYLFLKNEKLFYFGLFITAFSLTEFHVFQFAHYGLAEMMCISFILISLYFFFLAYQPAALKKQIRMIFYSALFLFLCCFTKINYYHVAAILPASVFLMAVNESFSKRKFIHKDYFMFYRSVLITVILFIIYFLFWVLPNRAILSYVLSSQVQGFYSDSLKMILADAWYIFINKFMTAAFRINIIHLAAVFIPAFILFVFGKRKFVFLPLFIFSFVWMLSEVWKFPMHYLPYRYLLSFIFACGVFIAAFYTEITQYPGRLKYLFFAVAAIICLNNFLWNYDAYSRRTFSLRAVDDYMANYDLKDKPVIGPWASSVCWKNKAVTLPVWLDYFNWNDPVNKLKPAAVVTEIDESDSNEAFKKSGTDLKKNSDSCRVFDVWTYKLAVYWIKKEHTD